MWSINQELQKQALNSKLRGVSGNGSSMTEFKDHNLVIKDGRIETVFAYLQKIWSVSSVYQKLKEEAGRGWWGDAQKYWFREDVASELALD